MQMSTKQVIMNYDDMRDSDWAIIEVLENERANAPFIAEKAEYSTQYIRERLGRMKEDQIVEALGHGLYAVNEANVPEEPDPDPEQETQET